MSCLAVRVCALAAVIVVCAWPQAGSAADLGGDCCADLEERIAELESTTVRKGNRKVSMTISGWVNQAVFFWDDGNERNAYVGTNGLEQDRFRFVGEAKIADGWTAGYVLEIGLNGADSKQFSQDDIGDDNIVSDRKTSWFVKSKDLGKLLVGRDASATYHLLDNIDFTLTRNVSDAEATGVYLANFQLRDGGAPVGAGVKWGDIMGGFNNKTPGQPGLRDVVVYDTPTVAGFTATAAWGEDDFWDVALTYKNDIGDFKVQAKAGYGESTDPKANGGQCAIASNSGNCRWWGAAGVIMHNPTGIFVYGAFAENELDFNPGVVGDDTSTMWYVQAGIERKWIALGKTNIFAEYRHDDVGLSKSATSSDLDFWAAGIIQSLENADMSLYAQYRHGDGDFETAGGTTNLDAFDMAITGAKINF
jgi:predicted porin